MNSKRDLYRLKRSLLKFMAGFGDNSSPRYTHPNPFQAIGLQRLPVQRKPDLSETGFISVINPNVITIYQRPPHEQTPSLTNQAISARENVRTAPLAPPLPLRVRWHWIEKMAMPFHTGKSLPRAYSRCHGDRHPRHRLRPPPPCVKHPFSYVCLLLRTKYSKQNHLQILQKTSTSCFKGGWKRKGGRKKGKKSFGGALP
ncbi:hypothetical protein TNIN_32421 [Trichonephila inaurata madagascariensis]|uniref:Uncharacterized protein n=1 Tax=Trichonephila inaurata madagascariensis TaxID=2747483 RepID=A0A8X6WS15_9ARAC|nr:hypothetical protein TNIN_32421 [Trichonephila inaurata madagascariensis]